MNQWIKNIHKDAIIRKNRQNSIELKCIVTKIKKSLERLSNSFEKAEQRTNELVDRTIDIIQYKAEAGKRIRKNEQSPRDL